jgi:predicted transcriptional regulator
VTAKRILDDFETRGWAVRDGRTYRTTPIGDALASAFADLIETVSTTRRLSTVLPWLPDSFDVGIGELSDVRVTLPDPSDSVAPVRRSSELMRRAREVRGLAIGIAPDTLWANRDRVVGGDQSFEVVFSEGVLEVIRSDPGMTACLREILEAGGRVYAHGNVEYMLAEFDRETVALGLSDPTGAPRAVLESDDEVMLAWFREQFEAHRSEATPLDAESLA